MTSTVSTELQPFVDTIIVPALAMLPQKMDTPEARVMLLAIALQESGCTARCQVLAGGGRGPARGLWQFERFGGVQGVLTHGMVRPLASKLCFERFRTDGPSYVWAALERDDVLACVLARLLLWTDVYRLPPIGDDEGAWRLYLRTWRPGKPRPDDWAENYARALETVLSC